MEALKENVVGMDGKPFEPKVVKGAVKLKIDGTPKKRILTPKQEEQHGLIQLKAKIILKRLYIFCRVKWIMKVEQITKGVC